MGEIESNQSEECYQPWLYPFDFMISYNHHKHPEHLKVKEEEKNTLYPAIPTLDVSESGERFIYPSEGNEKVYDDPLNPDAKCGKTKRVKSCKDHPDEHPRKLIPWDCGLPECPVCWKRALKRKTKRALELIWNSLLQGQLFIYSGLMLSSLIVSLPPSTYHLGYDGYWREFRKSLKYLGARGVAAIFHLWRFRDSEGNDLSELPVKISWRQFSQSGGSRVLAPHFHCVAIGKVAKSDIYFAKSGLIYKRMNKKPLTKKDVGAILYYAFTHSALSLDRQRKMIRYYGLFNEVYIAEEMVEWVADLCTVCSAQMETEYQYHYLVNGEDMFGLKVPSDKKVITRIWALRKKRKKDG